MSDLNKDLVMIIDVDRTSSLIFDFDIELMHKLLNVEACTKFVHWDQRASYTYFDKPSRAVTIIPRADIKAPLVAPVENPET